MLNVSEQWMHPGARERDLPGLMELYELNYIHLRRLISDLDALPDRLVSQVSGALDLHLTVVERSPYTTTLRLTYHFEDENGGFPAPDMLLRMYHDAQLAEVISHGGRRSRQGAQYDRFHHRYPLEKKWQANRFLHKWLGYCLHQGHAYSPARNEFSRAVQALADEPLADAES